MDVADEHITPSDLLRAEMRALSWVVEKLPRNMVENPNYHPQEDLEDLSEQERAEAIE